MITNLNFFIPVKYETSKTFFQSIIENVDDYFYLGGKRAYVIAGKIHGNSQKVEIRDDNQNRTKQQTILNAIKIASYMTIILPLLALALKTIIRLTHHYHAETSVERITISYKKVEQATNKANSSSTLKTDQAASTIFASEDKIDPSEDLTASTLFTLEDKMAPPVDGLALPSIASPTLDLSGLPSTDTVAGLMDQFTAAWETSTQDFNFTNYPFNLERFSQLLSSHAEKFLKAEINDKDHFGYIEKFDLNPSENPQIYIRADLHGDLKSLIENLRSLQEQGLMDQKYKCQPGVHLVFLGDYCDRGSHGTQILELLMRLREENPHQIHLIRGNHESLMINFQYGGSDERLIQIMQNENASTALGRFYETMSLTTYFSVDQEEGREYIQCTHGLFEPTMDPAPLLDRKDAVAYLPVPKERTLSERIKKIDENSNPALAASAKRIKEIVESSKLLEPDVTAYNWADIADDFSYFGNLGQRRYKLNAHDIQDYLNLSSELHRVIMIFRGHEHGFKHLMHNDRVIVTTLPVGMDCPAYNTRFEQPDIAYILKPTAKASEWKKRALFREQGHPITDRISDFHPLISSTI